MPHLGTGEMRVLMFRGRGGGGKGTREGGVRQDTVGEGG
jgi:hypothetical protein